MQGCDGSVLLDDTVSMIGEKQADQNVNSLKGFDLVDKIKEKLEAECPGVVSCADLLAVAAKDAVVLVSTAAFTDRSRDKLTIQLISFSVFLGVISYKLAAGWRALLGCSSGKAGLEKGESGPSEHRYPHF